jgi:hypothetical protein
VAKRPSPSSRGRADAQMDDMVFESKWAYGVSADGRSLVVSTIEQVVLFERIQ